MTKLEELITAEKRCQDTCSDYSCVRSSACRGSAGSELRSFVHQEQIRCAEKQELERQYRIFKKLADRYFSENNIQFVVKSKVTND